MTPMRHGWFHLATGAGVGRVLGFASNLLLSRWLGPTDLGLFNLVATTVQTSETLVRCGGDYALNFELGGQPQATQTELGTQLARGLVQICSLATSLVCVGVATWVWCGHGLLPISFASSHRFLLVGLLLLMIACEGISISAWEILLVSHRTAPLALRHGLFMPLRLLVAACGALFAGVTGAMGGWSFVALVQCLWLKRVLGDLWNPLDVFPLLSRRIGQLLRRGLPFYFSNLLSSIIFYPLLIEVANSSGMAEIGYLRAGQILQQVFAFLPATLVPVLFLRLRAESTFASQVVAIEKPMRIIWFILLEVLMLYCMLDHLLVGLIFGDSYSSSLLPTRLLLITALFECLAQLVVQPLLATGRTRLYGTWQNCAALFSAVLGWLWVPVGGLESYLTIRLIYVFIPLIGFGVPVIKQLSEPRKMFSLSLVSIVVLLILLSQVFGFSNANGLNLFFVFGMVMVLFLQWQDAVFLERLIMRRV